MPRTLNDAPCELVLDDRISNSKITLFHRLPTTEERIGYANEQIVRKGNKIENKTGETRIKYGLKILTGFKDGDFEKGEKQPLSADPQSPHYDPAWKTIIKKYAADIVILLAVHVFELSVSSTPSEPEEPEAAEDEPADAPAADKGGTGAEGRDENPL